MDTRFEHPQKNAQEFARANAGRKCRVHARNGDKLYGTVVGWGIETAGAAGDLDIALIVHDDAKPAIDPQSIKAAGPHILVNTDPPLYSSSYYYWRVELLEGYADWAKPATAPKAVAGKPKRVIPPFPHKCRCGAPALDLGTLVDCSSKTCQFGNYKRGFADQDNHGTGLDLMGFPAALLKKSQVEALPNVRELLLSNWAAGGCIWCGKDERGGCQYAHSLCFTEMILASRSIEAMDLVTSYNRNRP